MPAGLVDVNGTVFFAALEGTTGYQLWKWTTVTQQPVTIGSEVWVGGGASICPGVTIGSRTVIAAGSVVTRDMPAGVFAADNPCRIIRPITE